MGAGLQLAVTNECVPDLSVGPSPYASRSNHAARQSVRHCESAAPAQVSHPRHRPGGRGERQLSWSACQSVHSTCQHKSIRSIGDRPALGIKRWHSIEASETGSWRDDQFPFAPHRAYFSSIVRLSFCMRCVRCASTVQLHTRQKDSTNRSTPVVAAGEENPRSRGSDARSRDPQARGIGVLTAVDLCVAFRDATPTRAVSL